VGGLFVHPGAQGVEQQHVDERGQDRLRARAGFAQLVAEEIDRRAKVGVVADPRGQVDDLGSGQRAPSCLPAVSQQAQRR
jgi:hypothetical protein